MAKNLSDWQAILSTEAYEVCRLGKTEAPFSGKWCDHWQSGEYWCVCCGRALFSSEHKFESGCGWPSFDRTIDDNAIRYLADTSHNMIRTEIRCQGCDAHLGHVFDDGPTTTKRRYCVNSVALDFVKKAE